MRLRLEIGNVTLLDIRLFESTEDDEWYVYGPPPQQDEEGNWGNPWQLPGNGDPR